VIYNLGADEVEISRDGTAAPFVIYQGSHGDRGANRADIILPAAAYTEENGLFVNTEGRPQLAFRAGFAPGEAKENWAILRALSAELGAKLPWDSQAGLRKALVARRIRIWAASMRWPRTPGTPLELRAPAKATFRNAIKDFYLTNPIARASAVMAELSAMARARPPGKWRRSSPDASPAPPRVSRGRLCGGRGLRAGAGGDNRSGKGGIPGDRDRASGR
jgi:NADH-quinone oxidoreductase subunit G